VEKVGSLQPADGSTLPSTDQGRQPYQPDKILQPGIRPAVVEAGITKYKYIGWHTFSTLLKVECPAAFVPESMRQTGMRGALNGTRKEA